MRRIGMGMIGALFALGCGNGPTHTPPRPATPRIPAVQPSFVLHEWGLIGIETADSTRAVIATTAGRVTPGIPVGYGVPGKPVIYVHLDEGLDEARFDVLLDIADTSLLERFPLGGKLDAATLAFRTGWRGVVAERGACTSPTTLPTRESPTCTNTRDGFCEAAELERYAGDRETCLTVEDTRAETLFYRATGVSTAGVPLDLVYANSDWVIREMTAYNGPVFYIEAPARDSAPRIRAVTREHLNRPMTSWDAPSLTPLDVRNSLLDEASRRGLTTIEAAAFVDAWSTAFFDTPRRRGPVASGSPPGALAQAGRSLLFFAPEHVVDRMLPLETRPAARAIERVFLVRIVDTDSRFFPIALASPERLGHGAGGGAGGSPPCEHDCIRAAPHATSASEGLESEVVTRIMQRYRPSMGACYEHARRTDRGLTGRIELTFTIRRDGTVGASRVTSRSALATGVAVCIEQLAQQLTFPPLAGALNVDVRSTIDFSIENPTPP